MLWVSDCSGALGGVLLLVSDCSGASAQCALTDSVPVGRRVPAMGDAVTCRGSTGQEYEGEDAAAAAAAECAVTSNFDLDKSWAAAVHMDGVRCQK